MKLRRWQNEAAAAWEAAGRRGIVSVVTGGGKTVFALSCAERVRPKATLVIVPTVALLEQWWEEAAGFFDLELDEINIITGRRGLRLGTINIAILNTAAKLAPHLNTEGLFLILDECHKAASEKFRAALGVKSAASLGLSATPERPYDEGLDDVLVPALGRVVFTYGYGDALKDGVIVPIILKNLVFDLEPERQEEYGRLTKSIAVSAARFGTEAPETVALYIKRARVVNMSLNRVRNTIRLVRAHRGKRTLVFHEDIQACNLIHSLLSEGGIRCGVYHSGMSSRDRVSMLGQYRRGDIDVLVTCRALDEGFNVPETELGIIAASTATRRQRIQRLGRVLRPVDGKDSATIYTLVATGPEVSRLREEETLLSGVAKVEWSRA